MNSRFANLEEIKSALEIEDNLKNGSGLPLYYEDNIAYINNNKSNSLIIGIKNSCKTNGLILPSLDVAIKNNESMVIYRNNSIKDILINELEKNNYSILSSIDNIDFNDKFAIFIDNNEEIKKLILLFETKNTNRRINTFIYDFKSVNKIENFEVILNNLNKKNIIFNICINNYNDIYEKYGVEEGNAVIYNILNHIYLLSDSISTIEEISKLCGNKDDDLPLVSVSDIQNLKEYEAIVILPRMFPFKTKLKPYYHK